MQNNEQMLASAQQILARAEERPPRNEQETVQRVILPLLRELAGYNPEEDFHYEHSSLAGRADIYYPAQAAQNALWIEVKDWNTPLEDKHAVQLVNYVNEQGGRWGVLTNGQEWRLYDCHLTRLPAQDRLVLRAHKDDLQSIVDFMRVISKTAVDTRQVESWLTHFRLVYSLKEILENPSPNHPLFGSLRSALRKDFPNLRDDELRTALCEVMERIIQSVQSAASVALPSPATANQSSASAPVSPVSNPPQPASIGSTKGALFGTYKNWKQAYIEIVKYCYHLDAQKTLDHLRSKGELYNHQLVGQSGSILTTPLANNSWHFYTNLSSAGIQTRLREIASLFGLSGKQIQVRGEVFTL